MQHQGGEMKRKTGFSILFAVLLFSFAKILVSCDGGEGDGGVSGAVGLSGDLGAVIGNGNTVSLEGISLNFMAVDGTSAYTATTDLNGNVSIATNTIPPGTYTVVPAKERFTFVPQSQEIVVIQDVPVPVSSLHFAATPMAYIQGQVSDGLGNPVFGVQVTLNSQGVSTSLGDGVSVTIGDGVSVVVGGISFTVTDQEGRYAFYSLPSNGREFIVAPFVGGKSFASQPVNLTSDPMVLNFSISDSQLDIPIKIVAHKTRSQFGDSVAASADAKTIVTGCRGGTVNFGTFYIYKFINGGWQRSNIVERCSGPACSITLGSEGMAVSAEGDMVIVSDGLMNEILMYQWNGTNWVKTKTIVVPGLSRSKRSIALSADGNTLVAGAPYGDQGTVHVYKLNGNEWLESDVFYGPSYNLGYSVAVSGDGNTIVTATYEDLYNLKIYKWDGYAWTTTSVWACQLEGEVENLLISEDGLHIVSRWLHYKWDGSQWIPEGLPWINQEFETFGGYGGGGSGGEAINADGSVIVFGTVIYRWNGNNWDVSQLRPLDYGVWGFYGSNGTFGGQVALTSDGSVAVIGSWQDGESWLGTAPSGAVHRIPLN